MTLTEDNSGGKRGDRMTRKRKTVIFIMVASMILVASTAYARSCFTDGHKLFKGYQAYHRVFVEKSYTGQGVLPYIEAAEFMAHVTCVIDMTAPDISHVQIEQVYLAIGIYLQTNPTLRDICAYRIVKAILKTIEEDFPR